MYDIDVILKSDGNQKPDKEDTMKEITERNFVVSTTSQDIKSLKRRNSDKMEAAAKRAQRYVVSAMVEHNAIEWLLDNGFSDIDNVAYCPVKNTFVFGCRGPIKSCVDVESILQDFPYKWEI